MQELKNLIEGVQGVSPDLPEKITTLFEATVSAEVDARVKAQVAKLDEAFESRLAEATQAGIAEESQKVESFLDNVVVEWCKENAEKLDAKLKSELAETFLTGLRNLFVENDITPPEVEADEVIEKLKKRVSEAEDEAEELKGELEESKRQLVNVQRATIVAEMTEGLTETQADRVAALAEGFTLADLNTFRSKVALVVEAVCGTKPVKESDEGEEDDEDKGEGDKDKEGDDDDEKNKGVVESYQHIQRIDESVAAYVSFMKK